MMKVRARFPAMKDNVKNIIAVKFVGAPTVTIQNDVKLTNADCGWADESPPSRQSSRAADRGKALRRCAGQ
jgi:hypothetical protein